MNPLSIQLLLPPVTVGLCHNAFPSASAVRTAPAAAPAVTLKLVVVSPPTTSNLEDGDTVPIPTLPFSLTRNAGFIGEAPSLRIFIVGAPASPTTMNLAPGSVVPTPTLPLSFTLRAGFVGTKPS